VTDRAAAAPRNSSVASAFSEVSGGSDGLPVGSDAAAVVCRAVPVGVAALPLEFDADASHCPYVFGRSSGIASVCPYVFVPLRRTIDGTAEAISPATPDRFGVFLLIVRS
jgi:hypothetical protein